MRSVSKLSLVCSVCLCIAMAGVWSVPKVTVTVGYAAGVNRRCDDVSHLQHVTINNNCIWSQKVAQ